MKFIPLGMVGKPFGLRGEVRIRPFNPRSSWFETAEGIWLRAGQDKEPVYYRILSSRPHKEFVILALEGVRDRNVSESLRGMEAAAPEHLLEPLAEGEYYWHQLIGLKVLTLDGRDLGEVIRMEETAPELGGNDLLVVLGPSGEKLIPATGEVIEEVDLSRDRIKVKSIPGLTEE